MSAMLSQIESIEKERGSTVLVLAATALEMDLLPALHDVLRELGKVSRLDVVFYCRGGHVSAARRIALLLHEFTTRLGLVVPHFCESSGTIVALAAHDIVAGPVAIFSPIDPVLQASQSSGETPPAISAQDIRLFHKMSRDWFGLDSPEAQAEVLSVLCENIFPTTLTSFYRSTLEVRDICAELLELVHPQGAEEVRSRIIDRLLFGYHSHTYPLTRKDVKELGLPLRSEAKVEALAWEISRYIRSLIGSGVRQSLTDEWCDTILATRDNTLRRRRRREALAPVWEVGKTE